MYVNLYENKRGGIQKEKNVQKWDIYKKKNDCF